ncbi:hypothetical protein HanHA300_Chr15g0570871 [Helianthus annuus]|nr:hypothetical protein HanHA300_Chr15g0570871 [Helianthus annuus]KAJ0473612.1 hypothetical protein HanHA89_Chr15g0620331 [Helianthus annuus]KAJ0649189.1 hypothetical protein HanLR1_Chr15g0581431 [Helianthus annuus]KAJ0652991.1 hypothetical protein HanOQP8_Chr15g0578471 [Helianthus annuus]
MITAARFASKSKFSSWVTLDGITEGQFKEVLLNEMDNVRKVS